MRVQKSELASQLRRLTEKLISREASTAQLKLTIELIPETAANENLRSARPGLWNKLRKETYEKYVYRCGICGVEPRVEPEIKPPIESELKPGFNWKKRRLECHEAWEYDDVARIQKLSKLVALCTHCHQIKHWGWARVAWRSGKTWSLWDNEEKFAAYREGNLKTGIVLLEDHFMEINECSMKTLKEHVVEAAEKWGWRSQHRWRVDYGEYAELLPSDPQNPA